MVAQAAPATQVYAALKHSLAAIEREHKNSVLHFAEILQRKLYRDLRSACHRIHHRNE